jgi:hypothetical protein
MKLKKYIGYDFDSNNNVTVYHLSKSGHKIYFKCYCDTKSLRPINILISYGYHKNWKHTKFYIN